MGKILEMKYRLDKQTEDSIYTVSRRHAFLELPRRRSSFLAEAESVW